MGLLHVIRFPVRKTGCHVLAFDCGAMQGHYSGSRYVDIKRNSQVGPRTLVRFDVVADQFSDVAIINRLVVMNL